MTPTRTILLATIAMVLTQTTSKIILRKNLVINEIAEISVAHSSWKISLIIDTIPYKKLLMASLRDLRLVSKLTLKTINNNSGSFSSAHIGHFNDINNAVVHLNKTRRNLETTFKSYTLLKRRKRGLFNFIGDGLQFLFGVSTDSDLSDIRQAIKSLNRNQQKIAHLTKQSLSLYNMTRDSVQRNRDRINEINAGVRELFQTLNIQNNKINNIELFLNLYIKLNSILANARELLNELSTHLNDLTDIINHLSLGRIAPNVISPVRLAFILNEVKNKLPPSLTLPYETNKNIWNYYKTVRATTSMNNNKIYIMLDLPLINKNKLFTLYKVFNLPLPYTKIKKESTANLVARYRLDSEGVAINREKTQYIELNKKQLHDCTKQDTSFCELKNPILPYNTHRSCVLALINPNQAKINKYCKVLVDYKPRLPIATYVEDGLWIISSTHPITFSVACDRRHYSKTMKVEPPVDILKIEPSCTAYSDYLSLPPFYRLSSKYVLEDKTEYLRDRLKNQTFDHWEKFNVTETELLKWDKKDLENLRSVPIEELMKQTNIEPVALRPSRYTWLQISLTLFVILVLSALIIRCLCKKIFKRDQQQPKDITVKFSKNQDETLNNNTAATHDDIKDATTEELQPLEVDARKLEPNPDTIITQPTETTTSNSFVLFR